MSVATTSSTRQITVYVRLLGEGATVFRPTLGESIGPQTVRLLPTADYDPSDEEWEFPPETMVRVEARLLEGCSALVATSVV